MSERVCTNCGRHTDNLSKETLCIYCDETFQAGRRVGFVQGQKQELKIIYEELTAIGTYYMKWKLTKELIEKRLREVEGRLREVEKK